jgi:hypothetical protein
MRHNWITQEQSDEVNIETAAELKDTTAITPRRGFGAKRSA